MGKPDPDMATAEQEEGFLDCDFCGKAVRTRFCTLCGVDYCDGCRVTHATVHDEMQRS